MLYAKCLVCGGLFFGIAAGGRESHCNISLTVSPILNFLLNHSDSILSFSALTLLVGRQKGHPACETLGVGLLLVMI